MWIMIWTLVRGWTGSDLNGECQRKIYKTLLIHYKTANAYEIRRVHLRLQSIRATARGHELGRWSGNLRGAEVDGTQLSGRYAGIRSPCAE